jgi:hypothetical protein
MLDYSVSLSRRTYTPSGIFIQCMQDKKSRSFCCLQQSCRASYAHSTRLVRSWRNCASGSTELEQQEHIYTFFSAVSTAAVDHAPTPSGPIPEASDLPPGLEKHHINKANKGQGQQRMTYGDGIFRCSVNSIAMASFRCFHFYSESYAPNAGC